MHLTNIKVIYWPKFVYHLNCLHSNALSTNNYTETILPNKIQF